MTIIQHVPDKADTLIKMIELANKSLEVIGAASCWGAQDHRCETGPLILRSHGLLQELQREGYDVGWQYCDLPYLRDRETNTLPIIASYCSELATTVYDAVRKNRQFAVIGGDHSCAIGTWSGAHAATRDHGPMGLIWIDAHMDSHTPQTTHSGAIHGMPLAVLLGQGDPALTSIMTRGAKVAPSHVALIGVRSFEPEEAALLRNLGVRVFFIDEVRRRGMTAVMRDALEIVRNGTLSFGLSIDLDAIDPEDAPGVGSPEPNGIGGEALLESLALLRGADDLLGVEVVELNPSRDLEDRTAQLASDIIVASF